MTLNQRALQAVAIVSLLLVASCSNDSGPIARVPQKESEELSASHSRFEGANDPPFSAATHYAAGQLAESQGAFARAIEAYHLALAADAKHLPSLYRLGMVYTQMKDFPKAIDAWQRYRDTAPGDPAGMVNLGFCYELAGMMQNAELAYRRAVNQWPENAQARVNFGLMLARAGRVGEATVHLSATLPPAQVHYNLGSVYEQQGKLAQAKAAYLKAMELDPTCEARERLAAMK